MDRNIVIPKLRWNDVIRKDMKQTGAPREYAQDRRTWQMKTLMHRPNCEKGRRRIWQNAGSMKKVQFNTV